MTASIHFDRMAGLYAALINDQIVGAAETYHDAEVLLSSIHEAHHSGMIGGDPLLIEAQRFAERGSICAACEDQVQPCAVCIAPQDYDPTLDDAITCQVCGSPAHCNCHNRPLMAQCAAAIDACLGGPVANGGILDELRRVRAELRKAGY